MDPPADPDRASRCRSDLRPMLATLVRRRCRATTRLGVRDEVGRHPRARLTSTAGASASRPATATTSRRAIPELRRARRGARQHATWCSTARSSRSTTAGGRASSCCSAACTSRASRRSAGSRASVPVTYMLFDVLWLDGHSTMELPVHRTAQACCDELELNGPTWQTPPTRSVTGNATLRGRASGSGSRASSPSGSTRATSRAAVRAWLKVKNHAWARSSSSAVGSAAEGRSTGGLGSLLVGYHDDNGTLQYAGQRRVRGSTRPTPASSRCWPRSCVTPARSPTPRSSRRRRRVKPRVVVEVAFHEWATHGAVRRTLQGRAHRQGHVGGGPRDRVGHGTVPLHDRPFAWSGTRTTRPRSCTTAMPRPASWSTPRFAHRRGRQPFAQRGDPRALRSRREEADHVAAALAGAPFLGVPIVVKDLDGGLAGEPFHWGNRLPARSAHRGARFAPDREAPPRRFVIVGKTNCPRVRAPPQRRSPTAYGPSRNPWSTRPQPGRLERRHRRRGSGGHGGRSGTAGDGGGIDSHPRQHGRAVRAQARPCWRGCESIHRHRLRARAAPCPPLPRRRCRPPSRRAVVGAPRVA